MPAKDPAAVSKTCPKCGSKSVAADVLSDDEIDWQCRDCGCGWYEAWDQAATEVFRP